MKPCKKKKQVMLYRHHRVLFPTRETGPSSDITSRCKCFDKEIRSDGLYTVKYERIVN